MPDSFVDDNVHADRPPRKGVQPPAVPAGTSRKTKVPAGVQEHSGTESPRVTVVTKQAAIPSGGGKVQKAPAGVDHSEEGSV